MSSNICYCDECKHADYDAPDFADYDAPDDEGTILICGKGHKPKFFPPRSVTDKHWGWKRACNDFELDSDYAA
jgi:hypothetical protein